jgi:hypothetical protein
MENAPRNRCSCTICRCHGEELAERYVLHEAVESKRAVTDYETYRERLGYEPLEQAEIKALEGSCVALKARFGKTLATRIPVWFRLRRVRGVIQRVGRLLPTTRKLTACVELDPSAVMQTFGKQVASAESDARRSAIQTRY